MRWFWQEKENWRLVASLKNDVGIVLTHTQFGTTKDKAEGELYFHLFESNYGQRRIQVRATVVINDQEKLDTYAKSQDMYQTKLYRWLSGRRDPEILKYSEVEQEELVHVLKGTIGETL